MNTLFFLVSVTMIVYFLMSNHLRRGQKETVKKILIFVLLFMVADYTGFFPNPAGVLLPTSEPDFVPQEQPEPEAPSGAWSSINGSITWDFGSTDLDEPETLDEPESSGWIFILASVIACLGYVGLSSYIEERERQRDMRQREERREVQRLWDEQHPPVPVEPEPEPEPVPEPVPDEDFDKAEAVQNEVEALEEEQI